MSVLQNILTGKMNKDNSRQKTISDVMTEAEVIAEIQSRTDTGADETSKADWAKQNIIDSSLAQWGKANSQQSPVKLVISTSTGNGYMLTLENGVEMWSQNIARAGDNCVYYVLKPGMYYRNWDNASNGFNGLRKVLAGGPRIVTTQRVSEVEFEVAVRRELGGGVEVQQTAGSNSLF